MFYYLSDQTDTVFIMVHPDQKYIDALVNHDSRMIREIRQKCLGDIIKMVRQNNGTEADAEDVFQEAMALIIVNAGENNLTLTRPIGAYLYIVCRNKWINELKKRNRFSGEFSDTIAYAHSEDHFKINEEISITEGRIGLVERNLNKLSENCRKIIDLNRDRTMKDVARILNTTHGAARVAKCECMKKLIRLVEEDPEYNNLKW